VSVALAFIGEPKIIFLDEPSSVIILGFYNYYSRDLILVPKRFYGIC